MEGAAMPVDPVLPPRTTRIFVEPPARNERHPEMPRRPTSRVVKVSGVPDILSRDETRSIFSDCGRITDIWKNDRNDCFLEFNDKASAYNCLIMNGFSIVVESGARFTSRLSINYALEDEARKPDPPFSAAACNHVAAQLRDPNTLPQGTGILTRWFRNGECTKETADQFFHLLQITTEAVEKTERKNRRVNGAEAKLNSTISDIADYLNVLDQVFNHVNFNSILDNFDDHERQNLLTWKKEFEEAKVEIDNDQRKKNRNRKRAAKKKKQQPAMEVISREELMRLRQEKEDLELQLDVANLALVNERIEQQQQIDDLKNSVLEAQKQCAEYEAQLADWKAIHTRLQTADDQDPTDGLSSTEAKILTELSTYLGERLGATLSDIRTHLRRKDFHCTAKSIAQLMRRFPALFKEESVGTGTAMKYKWVFIGCRV